MKTSFKPIFGALLFALLLIASSYFLKKTSIGDWVDAAIYMIGAYFAFRYFMTSPIACMTRKVHDRQNLCSKFLALHLEKYAMQPTKVFAKAGLDNQTSSMCRNQQWFGPDVINFQPIAKPYRYLQAYWGSRWLSGLT